MDPSASLSVATVLCLLRSNGHKKSSELIVFLGKAGVLETMELIGNERLLLFCGVPCSLSALLLKANSLKSRCPSLFATGEVVCFSLQLHSTLSLSSSSVNTFVFCCCNCKGEFIFISWSTSSAVTGVEGESIMLTSSNAEVSCMFSICPLLMFSFTGDCSMISMLSCKWLQMSNVNFPPLLLSVELSWTEDKFSFLATEAAAVVLALGSENGLSGVQLVRPFCPVKNLSQHNTLYEVTDYHNYAYKDFSFLCLEVHKIVLSTTNNIERSL